MWIFLWLVLSLFVLGVYAWSQRILMQQKHAWSTFAKKNGFLYEGGKFTSAPAMAGKMGPHTASLYTGVQTTSDARGQRFVTVLQFEMGKGTPAAGAVSTKELEPFISALKFKETFVPDFRDWKTEYIIRTRDAGAMQKFLTHDRLETLHSVFSMKNSSALFFFDELDSVLRIETSDPLTNPVRLEKILKRLAAAADKLAPSVVEKIPDTQLPKPEPAPEMTSPETTPGQDTSAK